MPAVQGRRTPSLSPEDRHRLAQTLLIVPVLDEAEGLPRVLEEAQALGVATLVLDGGSTDGSPRVAQERGVPVLSVPRGKGRAWQAFLARYPYRDWTYLALVDGDATYDTLALPHLLAPLAEGRAEMAVGVRQGLPGAFTPLRRAGGRVLGWAVSLLAGAPCPDPLSGFRALRTDALAGFRWNATGFGLEAELTVAFLRRGLRVAWVPVAYRPRLGRSKLRPWMDGGIILLTALNARLRRRWEALE